MSTVQLLPDKITLNEFKNIFVSNEKQYHIYQKIDELSQVDCFAVFRKEAKHIVCLMPSAQLQSAEVTNPIFHRWTWAYQFKDQHVISLSDPAIYKTDLHASWFLSSNKDIDYINNMAIFIRSLAEKFNIPENKIILYGSSMGGFGALMIASKLSGALAIAEVPQINLMYYPIKKSLEKIEHAVLNGQSFYDFSLSFSERVNIIERFKFEKFIPPFRLITNMADGAYNEHIDMFYQLDKIKSCVNAIGDTNLTIISEPIGHKPLASSYGVSFIQSAISEGWQTTKCEVTENRYEGLIKDAVKKASTIKYIRDEKEKIEYEKLKEMLYEAVAINPTADWPYLKICSIVKLWTNSFNEEILNSALNAFTRKQTLEAFIYACRGFLYNRDFKTAAEEIDVLINKTIDQQTANIGNIFKAIVAYEQNDYEKYQYLIKKFKDNKATDFETYIAIPVSTVYTDGLYANENFKPNNILLLSQTINIADFSINNEKYIISASCDEKYFFEYAEYLVRSFSEICSEEGILHLSIVSGDIEKINEALKNWNAKNIFISLQHLDARDNVGPIASLLRFVHVYPLLEKYVLPVFVLDLDCVIKKSFINIINIYRNTDIGSRILGNGVAPWEKYTGGFAMFNPTLLGIEVAKNIAYVASKQCNNKNKQWWIDQNCFEAGIRSVYQFGKDLHVENMFSIRDTYCIMPVGSGESKKYNLEKALSIVTAHQ